MERAVSELTVSTLEWLVERLRAQTRVCDRGGYCKWSNSQWPEAWKCCKCGGSRD